MKSRLSWVALVCCAPAWAQPSTSEPSVPVEQYHYGMHLDGDCQIFCVRAGNGLPSGRP